LISSAGCIKPSGINIGVIVTRTQHDQALMG
jgi:hypothetical protein